MADDSELGYIDFDFDLELCMVMEIGLQGLKLWCNAIKLRMPWLSKSKDFKNILKHISFFKSFLDMNVKLSNKKLIMALFAYALFRM